MVAIQSSLLTRENRINTPQSVSIFVVGLIFTILSLTFFGLRVWAKRINKNKLVIEDFLCLGGLACVVGLFVCIILHIQLGGVGHHFADLPPQDLGITLQILVAFQTLYALAVGTVKTSICHFYVRIFFKIDRLNRNLAYGVIVFIWAWVVMSILVAYLSCTPFEFTWNPTLPGGHCVNQVGAFVAEAVLDLVADIMVFTLPLRSIWKLQVSDGKKVVLFVVFGLGLSTMAMAIARIVALAELQYTDFQWSSPNSILFTLLEPAIGILVACIPLLQPIFQNTWLGRQIAGSRLPKPNPYHRQKGYVQQSDDQYPLTAKSGANSGNANSIAVTANGHPSR